MRRGVNQLQKRFDAVWGGFGQAPKFPTPHNLLFLLNYHALTKDESSLEMAERTLAAMAHGGIFDQIGGGFSRYSTDERWLAPHFEKMLYDNALLTCAYLDAFRLTANPFYRLVARLTISYVLRELTGPTAASAADRMRTATGWRENTMYSPPAKCILCWDRRMDACFVGGFTSQRREISKAGPSPTGSARTI